MTRIGYARVSTTDQDLTLQREALTAAGCTVIREEKVTGTTRSGRKELATILDFIRAGDVLVVTRIDRLARSIGDLQDVVRTLKAKGADLKATEQAIDTSTAAGKAFLDMLEVFAEFGTNLRRERQLEGIAKATPKGPTRAASAGSTVRRCRPCSSPGKAPPPSPRPSGARGCRSIGCWARGRRRELRQARLGARLSAYRFGAAVLPCRGY